MRLRVWVLAMGLAALACAHESTTAPGRTDDPFAALTRLADDIQEAARFAQQTAPSSVPRGEADGALHVVRLLLRAIDEELAWADTLHPYFVHQDTRFAKLADVTSFRGEDCLHAAKALRGEKRPDAIIFHGNRPQTAIEYVGSGYHRRRLEDFHTNMAKRGLPYILF